MTDITGALSRARFMLDNLPAGHADRVVCEALLALAAEREAMAKVVEAAEAWRMAPPGFDGPERTLSDTAEVQLARALDALALPDTLRAAKGER